MAKVQKYFEKFHAAIRVDYDMSETLREKRDRILNRIRDHLKKHGRPGFKELLQGSYKMKTGVIPVPGLEYDIDVGLRFGITEKDHDADTVRGWVFEAVDGHTEDVKSKGPCIRVTYADGYHVDLVVYAWWTDALGVEQFRLAHDSGGWRPANPPGLLEHVDNARAQYDGTQDNETKTDQFRRCVRYLRRWDDVAMPKECSAKPSGLAYVLLGIQKLRPARFFNGDADDRTALKALSDSAANTFGRLVATKPTPEYEDMFRRLSDEEMTAIKDRFRKLSDALRDADQEPDPVKACKLLRELFGPDFPVPAPEDTGKKTFGPAILTSSSSA